MLIMLPKQSRGVRSKKYLLVYLLHHTEAIQDSLNQQSEEEKGLDSLSLVHLLHR